MECFAAETWLRGLRIIAYWASTFVFSLVGAVVGAVTGAIAGLITEAGFIRGTIIGLVAGSVTSTDALDSFCMEESLSKAAIFPSLMDGILKVYQWQINNLQSGDFASIYDDIFNIANKEGMAWESVKKLPEFRVSSSKVNAYRDVTCAVCLQGFKKGQRARRLPVCCHLFHADCIDAWLIQHRSCPMCRISVAKVVS